MSDNIRTRNWVFIAYPENISESDLDQFLSNLQIECVRSPLHEPVGDGIEDERKAHWHILLCFNGVKSYTQVKAISDQVKGCPPVVCHSVRGSVRYFVHADNPDKEQFVEGYQAIKSFCGLDVFELFCPTSAEKDMHIRDMINWIQDNNIYEFSDLFDYAKELKYDTWFFLLTHGSAHLMQIYISSRRNKIKLKDVSMAQVEEYVQKSLTDFIQNGLV